MLRLTLAQMRRSIGRLTAAGIAIVIGTAFLTATLLAGNVLTRTTYDAITTELADADLVVTTQESLTAADLEAIGARPGVDAVSAPATSYTELIGSEGSTGIMATTPAPDPRLEPVDVFKGRAPAAVDEIALPDDVAERLGVGLDDEVLSRQQVWSEPEPGGEGSQSVSEERLTVVGLIDSGASAFLGAGGVAMVTPELAQSWDEAQGVEPWRSLALVAVAEDASVPAVQEAITQTLDDGGTVRTQDEHAEEQLAQMTSQTNLLTSLVAGFAVVALLVASLVIANTFQVLVAQRTRTLALLRCVGANKSQLRRSVVLEALMLGTSAAVAGIALGIGAVQVALTVLGRNTDVPLPAGVTVTAVTVLLPLLAGVAVTVGAALAPARAATRVSPLAALQPTTAPTVSERSGRSRAWLSGLMVVGGGLGLAGGVVLAVRVDLMLGLALGVLSGAVSFFGVMLSAVFWVPRLVGSLGRMLGRAGGPASRLAAANSVRNPRRTSATSAALLIGVTLVVMMATGAAGSRTALNDSLDQEFSVDVAVRTSNDGAQAFPLPSGFVQEVAALDGVAATTTLTSAQVLVRTGDAAVGDMTFDVGGVDLAEAQEVLRRPDQLDGLTDATVIVPQRLVDWYGLSDGQDLELQRYGADGEPTGAPLTFTAVVTSFKAEMLVLTDASLERLVPDAATSTLWGTLDDLDRAGSVVADIEDVAADTQVALSTQGAAVERAFYQRVVDTLLAVVVGLLGVAVVIALIGVANTLSLSVIERRRESATLRAIGLSRRQLRGMLAVEGVLIAVVGALAGSVLGVVYGWVGSQTLLGEMAPVTLVVPWGHLGLVLLVALLAGFLASVLPGRSAARTSPVEALAVD